MIDSSDWVSSLRAASIFNNRELRYPGDINPGVSKTDRFLRK